MTSNLTPFEGQPEQFAHNSRQCIINLIIRKARANHIPALHVWYRWADRPRCLSHISCRIR